MLFSNYLNKYTVIIFLISLFIFNINIGHPIESGDTISTALVPFSIIEKHTIFIDQFAPYYVSTGGLIWFLHNHNGNWISSYPIITSLIVTVIYIPFDILLHLFDIPLDMYNENFRLAVYVIEKFSASVITALTGVIIFIIVKELYNKNVGLIGWFIFAFCTNNWSVGSQALFPQGTSELLITSILLLIILKEKECKIIT
jgi:hypothetical protein